MTKGVPDDGKSVVQILLSIVGVVVLGAGFLGYFGEQDDVVAGGFVAAGVLLVLVAAFFPWIEGTIELAGMKLPVGARRAEKQLEQGKVVDASAAESAWKAIEQTLSEFQVTPVDKPPVKPELPPTGAGPERQRPRRPEPGELETRSESPGPPRIPARAEPAPPPRREVNARTRSVQLVDDAVVTMGTLTADERRSVLTEIARMSGPEFQPESDPKAIRRGDGGRAYHVRRVGGTNLRLWYRPLKEDEPSSPLVVMVIERKGEG
ncbi:hypothetical protein [Mycolicibacterium elephantis]